MTDADVRAAAAKMLDNIAAVELDDVNPSHAGCFYCRQSATNAAQLQFAAAVLREPEKLILLHRGRSADVR